jgi:hypothetical protein
MPSSLRPSRIVGVLAILSLTCLAACKDDDDSGTNEGGAKEGGTESDAGVDATSKPTKPSKADASDAGESTADAMNWDLYAPNLIPGICLWLNEQSPESTGSTTDTWGDQSGQANAAFVDGDSVVTVTKNVLNGHAVIGLDGSEYFNIYDRPTMEWGTRDFMVSMVVRYTNPAPNNVITVLWQRISGEETSSMGLQILGAGGGGDEIGSVETSIDQEKQVLATKKAYDDGNWHIIVVRRVGGTKLELRVDKVVQATATIPVQDITEEGLPYTYLGGTPDLKSCMVGQFAEVIAVTGSFSDSALDTLEGYYSNKFAL